MRIRDMIKEVALLTQAHIVSAAFNVRAKVVKAINPNAIIVRGDWNLVLRDEHGNVKARRWIPCNVVVDAGKSHLANHLATVSTAYPMSYLAIGTGTTAEAASQTALTTEVGTRVDGTKSNPSGAIYRVVGTFASGNGTGSITEAGLFSASTAGTMLNRKLFSAINKGSNDSLEITMEITFS